jgi:hypothetical protein
VLAISWSGRISKRSVRTWERSEENECEFLSTTLLLTDLVQRTMKMAMKTPVRTTEQ